MSIVHIDLFFKLPDDFNGGFDDIIKELMKFRKLKGSLPKCNDYAKEFDNNTRISKSGYESIMINKIKNGKTLVGVINIVE